MSNGPTPTTLISLNDLVDLPKGSKVRFLGCVTDYAVKTGILALQHASPPSSKICPTALVDVNLLLSTLKSTDIQRGAWLNVMGYVNDRITGSKRGNGERIDVGITVQAVLLWPAGSVRLGEYEKALAQKRKKSEDEGEQTRQYLAG